MSVFNLTTCLFILAVPSVVGEDQSWQDFAAKRFAKEKPLQLVPTQRLPETHNEVRRDFIADFGPDFGPYMVNLQKRVNAVWQRSENARVVVVIFKIYEDGSISNLRIDKSCGIAKEDQGALDAIRKSSPFEHLPEGVPKVVDIQFTFDDKVFRNQKQ
ncbi:MAG: TonB C-terminal domain-containing protein [Candidatus Obscuribacterales bacterium]|nr:TonB C-terminal domain-containing protein [Candidatus Obscuribacterales bacterium]